MRRKVLVEAGHRCALPTCRHIDVDVHHIVPYEKCKKHKYENLIALCPNCHRRTHKGEIDIKSLKTYKANLRFTHDKFSQFEVDILFESAKLPPRHAIPFPPFMILLIKRLLESGYVQLNKNPHGSGSSFGMQISPDLLVITPKGSNFVASLGVSEL
ncbi:MAG: HNH endonuclease [Epsilonproteobacteria bacterium]|nr:HNH endonuclease [Campylobacterota bacterium]